MKKHIETPIQKRFADTDILGHINNINLQHYFDLGKMDFYHRVLGGRLDWKGPSLILVATSNSYLAQTRIDDEVRVETYVEKIGTKSISFYQTLVNCATGALHAECRTVAVGFDFARQVSIELLPEWRERLEEYL